MFFWWNLFSSLVSDIPKTETGPVEGTFGILFVYLSKGVIS